MPFEISDFAAFAFSGAFIICESSCCEPHSSSLPASRISSSESSPPVMQSLALLILYEYFLSTYTASPGGSIVLTASKYVQKVFSFIYSAR